MANELVQLHLNAASPQVQEIASDNPQGVATNNLDEDDIIQCVMRDFHNDCKDKEDYGWMAKRQYDVAAYYGYWASDDHMNEALRLMFQGPSGDN